MSKEEQIKALKNPENQRNVESPVGKTLNELSPEELTAIQGASDVNPETTPLCVAYSVGATIVFSVKHCRG